MNLHRHLRPDPSTTDRLLAGKIGPDDAPPGFRRVATLLGEAGSGFEAAAPAEGALIGAMVEALQTAPAPLASGRKSMLRKVLAAKTAAIVGVLALSASGAAAATGNLPDTVQDKVAKAAKHVGVNLPTGTARVTEGCEAANSTPPPRNRGQYLKQVRKNGGDVEAAKLSRCGMPVVSDGTPDAGEADEADVSEGKGKSDESHGKSGEDHGNAGVNENEGQAGEDHGDAGATENPGQAGEDHGNAGATENPGQAGEEHPPPSVIEGLPVPVPGATG